MPALAVGYRLPNPQTELDGYLANVVLSAILSDGDASRLQQRMVQNDALVTDLGTNCGLFSPLDARDPDTFTITAFHPTGVSPDAVLTTLDQELDKLAGNGPEPNELARVTARWTAELYADHDRIVSRTLALGGGRTPARAGRADRRAARPDRRGDRGGRGDGGQGAAPDSRAVLLIKPAGGAE